MESILRYAGILACALVLAGCICRIGLMQRKRNRFVWWLIYALHATYSAGVLLDLLMARRVDWYEFAGVGGVLLYLEVTRRQWRHGPPPETRSDRAPLGPL
ncbi:hypothetical protein [Variovorax sp. PAMC26660]|uniref:hypothetical protein n=1 Tax=Variovorax sp. PAMC26660 TaxID=2762322 RepID=UPI00164D2693|nr:hypothetical protein [Variovorax sp. PAMC26660]QNK67826.1 hypothetical protein H7F35_32670 [Variovorax sp. PAMC26660]